MHTTYSQVGGAAKFNELLKITNQIVFNFWPVGICCGGYKEIRMPIFPNVSHCILLALIDVARPSRESGWKDNPTAYIAGVSLPIQNCIPQVLVAISSKRRLLMPQTLQSLSFNFAVGIDQVLLEKPFGS